MKVRIYLCAHLEHNKRNIYEKVNCSEQNRREERSTFNVHNTFSFSLSAFEIIQQKGLHANI